MYTPHPSSALNNLFKEKPYQGVAPDEAEFLFVGLDANYHPKIESQPIFSKVIEYHHDSVAFWQKYGVHHPFLLSGYTGDGKRFHLNFAKIGFQPQHANLVSFIELLHVPTIGQSKLEPSDLNKLHLQMLNSVITNGRAKHIFLSNTVIRLISQTEEFSWFTTHLKKNTDALKIYFQNDSKTIYSHLHFSTWGKFELKRAQQAREIRHLIPEFAFEKDHYCEQNESITPDKKSFSQPKLNSINDEQTIEALIDALKSRSVDTDLLPINGIYTNPKSYGVYELINSNEANKKYRHGNHPIRLKELAREFVDCKVIATFLNRDDAALLTKLLNNQAKKKSIDINALS